VLLNILLTTIKDAFGAIVFLSEAGEILPSATEVEIKLLQAFAAYITHQLED